MDVMILMVITVFFALVGLVDLMVGTSRWMHRTGQLSEALLVVEVSSDEKAAEAMLLQAADITARNPELYGIRMVVVCQDDGEAEKICRRFCDDRGIPVVSKWDEINGIMRR